MFSICSAAGEGDLELVVETTCRDDRVSIEGSLRCVVEEQFTWSGNPRKQLRR